ncbi:MAG: sensor histidine kinase [Spirochaetota bacterium]
MKFIYKLLLFILLFFFANFSFLFATASHSYDVSTSATVNIQSVQAYLQKPYFASIRQLLRYESKQSLPFRSLAPGTFAHPWTTDFWLKFSIQNPSSQPVAWILEQNNSEYPFLDFYVQTGSGYEKTSVGRTIPLSLRKLHSPLQIIPINLAAAETKIIYVHLRSSYKYRYSFSMMPRSNYFLYKSREDNIQGVLLGIILAMLLVNSCLFFFLKESLYIYYILYSCSFVVFLLLKNNLHLYFFRPLSMPELQGIFLLLVFFISLWHVLFTKKLLSAKQNFPAWSRSYSILLACVSMVLAVQFALNHIYPLLLAICISVILFYASLLGFLAWYGGIREARFFLVSFFPIFVLVLMEFFPLFGIYMRQFQYGLEFGLSMQMLLLSIAIGDKMSLEQKKNSYYQARVIQEINTNLQKEKEYSTNLEENVRERTVELEWLNQELLEANQEKDKFFTIIAHDLRSPLSGLLSLVRAMHASSEENLKKQLPLYTKTLLESAEKVFQLLESLLQWANSQMREQKIQQENLYAIDVVEEVAELYHPAIQEKQIVFHNQSPIDHIVYADLNMLRTILRNLLSNAVKFTPRQGKISIGSEKQQDRMLFYVQDSGVGISTEHKNKLFSLREKISHRGTSGEKGSGFGLILCKELVERQGGEIFMETLKEVGTIFYFTLPLGKRDTGEKAE